MSEVETPAKTGTVTGRLGVWAIVLMVLSGTPPLAVIVANVPLIISLGETSSVAFFFIITGALLVIFSVGFTRMARYVKNAGAFFTYILAGLGKLSGTGSAMVAIVAYFMVIIAEVAYFGEDLSAVIAHYSGWVSPWWIWALLAIIIFGLLGYRDIVLSARVLGVLLGVETLLVAALDISVFAQSGRFAVETLSPAGLTSPGAPIGILFAVLCYIGFEATAVYRSEAKDPEKTIPRATYVSVIGIGLFFTISSIAVVTGVAPGTAVDVATANPADMTLAVGRQFLGAVGGDLMQIFLLSSLFACGLAFHNVTTRYLRSLGLAHIFPQSLGAYSPRFKAPTRASLTISVITLAVMLVCIVTQLDPINAVYAWFSGGLVYGVLVLMTLTSLAVVVFFRHNRDVHPVGTWRGVVAPLIAFVGLAAVLVLACVNVGLLIADPIPAAIIVGVLVVAFVYGAIASRTQRVDIMAALDAADL